MVIALPLLFWKKMLKQGLGHAFLEKDYGSMPL